MKINPRKRFGQNFLQDNNVIQSIVHAISPSPNDNMVEIGPGLGAITKPLLETLQHLTVIELDRDLINHLEQLTPKSTIPTKSNFPFSRSLNSFHSNKRSLDRESYSSSGPKLTIYNKDALKFDFNQLAQKQENTNLENNLRIVGNLPYNISTQLIFHLLSFSNMIKDMHFMLQKEVVDRICAKPHTKAYGKLSIMVQYYATTHNLLLVPNTAFYPIPKVESSVVRIVPYKNLPHIAKDFKRISLIVTTAFNQRRKTLQNALKSYFTPNDFIKLNIVPTLRPEQLSVVDYVNLSNYE